MHDFARFVAAALVLLAPPAFFGCEGGTPAEACGPANCATGCCNDGVCRTGNEADACGAGGAACSSCAAGQSCSAQACSAQAAGLELILESVSHAEVGGEIRVPVSAPSADVGFRLNNDSDAAVTGAVTLTPETAPGWTIVPPLGDLATQTVEAKSHREYLVQFDPPASAGQSLEFTLAFTQSGGVLASRTVKLVTVE